MSLGMSLGTVLGTWLDPCWGVPRQQLLSMTLAWAHVRAREQVVTV